MTVDWFGANPTIFASTSENGSFGSTANRLIKVVDTGSNSIPTTLATTVTNGSFRGVAFVPQANGPQSQIQGYKSIGDNFVFTWRGMGGGTYVLQYANVFVGLNPLFQDSSNVFILNGQGLITTNFVDPGATRSSPSRFYRIRSIP